VERSSRYVMLVHLPRMDGYGTIPRVYSGPALADYGAVAMKDALIATMTTMPEELLRSLTWDRGGLRAGRTGRAARQAGPAGCPVGLDWQGAPHALDPASRRVAGPRRCPSCASPNLPRNK